LGKDDDRRELPTISDSGEANCDERMATKVIVTGRWLPIPEVRNRIHPTPGCLGRISHPDAETVQSAQ